LLAVLYSEARDRYALEKTTCELEEIKKEFCKAQESVQEYLDTNKDGLSSQAWAFSGKLHNLHAQEMIACQRVTKLEEGLREKEESVKCAQKKMEEEEIAHTHSLVGRGVQESLLAQTAHFVRKIIQCEAVKSLAKWMCKVIGKLCHCCLVRNHKRG